MKGRLMGTIIKLDFFKLKQLDSYRVLKFSNIGREQKAPMG